MKGIAGIYKGQVVTLWREASGYGIYFWAYEKLMQREMATKGIKRDQVSPVNAVLYGAAAGYAVCRASNVLQHARSYPRAALGDHIPNRHDQVAYANGRLFARRWSKVQIDSTLRSHGMADRGCWRVHTGSGTNTHSVRLSAPPRTCQHIDIPRCSSPFANGATFLGFELANRFMNSLIHEGREVYP